MLELKNVHTYYGNIHALKGVSLVVNKGEVVTLIGSNGAGKTTTHHSGHPAPARGVDSAGGRGTDQAPAA